MRPLTSVLLSLALAGPALAGPDLLEDTQATLGAVDRAVVQAASQAASSVVSIHVKRNNYGPKDLSPGEKAMRGIRGYVPPGYFARPDGPGSGVVIAPGLVATSMWTLAGDGAVEVSGPDGKRYPAERVGRHEGLRVILLKVEDQGALKPLKKATSPALPGRTLMLLGRSEQGNLTVTRGIVSGLKRERAMAFTHSCRTSYGNVGGALVDLEGNLVGIAVRHSEKASQGQSSGVGFGALVVDLLPNLDALARGKVFKAPPRAFLGIGLDQRYTGDGVRVGRIIEGTAAAKVGIKEGDVITVFNSVKIEHFAQLVEEILKLGVGAEIIVTVRRDGDEMDFTVKLGTRPEDEKKK
ncbi:MAG: trypsin-like peptidase domain-containing protein [Planctomycetes bacterium]|nr:trypsin-like peptidase domain-containing protein [Planctomycetota bacterium]